MRVLALTLMAVMALTGSAQLLEDIVATIDAALDNATHTIGIDKRRDDDERAIIDNFYQACLQAGSGYPVAVMYQDGTVSAFKSGGCIAYQAPDGTLAKQAVFCRAALCETDLYPGCALEGSIGDGVYVAATAKLWNKDQFLQHLGEWAKCFKSS